MANFGTAYLTNLGRELRDKASIQGFPIQVTRMALGSGEWPAGTEAATLTALLQEEMSLAIQGLVETSGGQHKVTAVLTNEGLEQGFDWRELAVFCQDPDAGEILYMVSHADKPDFVPAGGGAGLVELAISMIIRTAIGVQVTAVIDDTLVLATKRDVDVVAQDLAAHKDDGGAHGAVSTATANAIVRRDASGRARFGAPSNASDAARKADVDAHAVLTGGSATPPHGATPDNVANALVKRDALGRFKVSAPAASDDVARKAEVDVVQGNLDTHAGLTGASNPHGATSAATANAVVRRDASGRARFGAPSNASDAARKADVDAHAALTGGSATPPHGATPDNVANALVRRDALGRLKAAAPAEDDQVARLAEVLSRLPLSGGTLTGLLTAVAGVYPKLPDNVGVDGNDPQTVYPFGLSYQTILATHVNWPEGLNLAAVWTFRGQFGTRSFQLYARANANPARFYIRGGNNDNTWRDWAEFAQGGRGDAATIGGLGPSAFAPAAHAAETGTSAPHGATPDNIANALVRRDASGRARFSAPSHAEDAARKGDVDGHAALTGGSATPPHGATPDNIANALVRRDALGRLRAAAPAEDDQVARLAEVLSRLPLSGGTLTGLLTAEAGVYPHIPPGSNIDGNTPATGYPRGLSYWTVLQDHLNWPESGLAAAWTFRGQFDTRSFQLYVRANIDRIYWRGCNSDGSWRDWIRLPASGDVVQNADIQTTPGSAVVAENNTLKQAGVGISGSGQNVWTKLKSYYCGMPGVYRVTYNGHRYGDGGVPRLQIRTSDGYMGTVRYPGGSWATYEEDVTVNTFGATIEVWGYSDSQYDDRLCETQLFRVAVGRWALRTGIIVH